MKALDIIYSKENYKKGRTDYISKSKALSIKETSEFLYVSYFDKQEKENNSELINSMKKDEIQNDNIDVKHMTILAIATSIDALAVGITFSFLKVNVILAITLIGIITFILSVMGTKIGNRFGDKYESKAELVGGIILVLLGVKILLEHLEIIAF